MNQNPSRKPPIDLPEEPPQPLIPTDMKWAVGIAVFFVLHIAIILRSACPFWTFCFPLSPLEPILWPTAAVISAGVCLSRAAFTFASAKRSRVAISILLLLFVVDSATDGNFRWFEIAMRRQSSSINIDALQAWAEVELSSSQQRNSWAEKGLDGSMLPRMSFTVPLFLIVPGRAIWRAVHHVANWRHGYALGIYRRKNRFE